MGRAPCCSKVGLKRGPWSVNEDTLLTNYVQQNGEGKWISLPKKAGLLRCGKSCRLRWMNYLRPGIVRGDINQDEEDLIVRLHRLLGNRWSLIAGRLPGRTDNEIKNYWNTHLLKKLHNADIKLNNYLPKQRKIKKSNTKTEKEENKQKNELNAKLNGSSNKTHGQLNMNDPPKVKVYTPKPIRLSAVRTNSLAGVDAAKAQVALSPLFELGGDEDDLLQVSCDQNMLQEVYNEYLKLL